MSSFSMSLPIPELGKSPLLCSVYPLKRLAMLSTKPTTILTLARHRHKLDQQASSRPLMSVLFISWSTIILMIHTSTYSIEPFFETFSDSSTSLICGLPRTMYQVFFKLVLLYLMAVNL